MGGYPGQTAGGTIIHQCLLSRPVTEIHAADLRKRDMRLVHDDQEIIREIVEQRTRRLSRCRSHKMTGIVLDSGTKPVSLIISTSKLVRSAIRCASRSLSSLLKRLPVLSFPQGYFPLPASSFLSVQHSGTPGRSPHVPAALSPLRSAPRSP